MHNSCNAVETQLPDIHPLCEVSDWLRKLLTLADGYRQDTES